MELQWKNFFWEYKGKVEYVDQWPIMTSPYPMLMILAVYLIFVLILGPTYMKNREPYHLKNAISLYNTLQVIFSVYAFQRTSRYLYQYGFFYKTCNLDKQENLYEVTSLTYMGFLSKLSDLIDTIFFVLRKKQKQISFLHLYHHVSMVIAMWVTAKYDQNENGIFLGALNAFVHAIMYTYYFLSAFPKISKYLWWKKYLTSLQLLQFVLMLAYISCSFFISPCPFGKAVLSIIYLNGFMFLYLFGKFYVDSYTKKKM